MHNLEVADGCLAPGAPIDHVPSAIDQAFAIQPEECFQNRAIERRFKREPLTGPIARGPQADHLLLDDAAAFRFPLPDAFLEFFAAEVLPGNSFFRELPLHYELRCNARVVHSRKPQRPVAAHTMPSHEHVDLRMFEQVTYVDRTGDIRRWQRNRETGARAGILGAE